MGAEPEADTMGTCPNCHSLVMGPFCSQCGQPQDTHRRTIGKLIGDLLIDIASFDSRVMRTGWALLFRPGELACAFREGRTQRYVPAVWLYLFVTLVFFLFLTAGHIAIVQLQDRTQSYPVLHDASGQAYFVANRNRKHDLSAAQARQPTVSVSEMHLYFFRPYGFFRSEAEVAANNAGNAKSKFITQVQVRDPLAHMKTFTDAWRKWMPWVVSLLLFPFFALLLALVYRRQRRDFLFVDHLVFSLSYHSFAFVLILIAVWLRQTSLDALALWLVPVGLGLYLVVAMRRFYRQNWFLTLSKSVVSVAGHSIFLMMALTVTAIMGAIYV